MNTQRFWRAVVLAAGVAGVAAVGCVHEVRGDDGAAGEHPADQAAAAAAPGALRYSVMVAKFESGSQWAAASAEWGITNAWSEMLTSKLVESGHFNVIAEKDMRVEGRQEQEFNESEWAQEGGKDRGTRKVETGHMTGAQLLIKGTITHIAYDKGGARAGGLLGKIPIDIGRSKAEVNLTLQVIDAQTGMVVASKSIVGKANKTGIRLHNLPVFHSIGVEDNGNLASACDEALGRCVEVIVGQLDKVSWTGKVVSASPSKIVVNRGTREGVSVGLTFVVGDAEQIIDPDTGEVLDHDLTEVARLEVVKVAEKIAYCRIVDGEVPTEGMMIRLPS